MIRFALAFVFIVASLSAATVRNPMPGWMAPPGASGGGGAAIHDSLAANGIGGGASVPPRFGAMSNTLIWVNDTGEAVLIPPGSAGNILTSNGLLLPPTFTAPAEVNAFVTPQTPIINNAALVDPDASFIRVENIAGGGVYEYTVAAGVPSENFRGVAYGGGMYVLVAESGKIYSGPSLDSLTITWGDSGPVPALNTVTYQGAAGISQGFWAGGANGTFLHSADGITWTSYTSTNNRPVNNILWLDALKGVLAQGENFFFDAGWYYTTDGGVSWTYLHRNAPLFAMVTTNGTNVYTVGGSGTTPVAYYSSSLGASTPITTGLGSSPLYSLVLHNGVLIAAGANGDIRTAIPAGSSTTWTARTSGTTESLRLFVANGRVYAVGSNGVSLESSDNGATWQAGPLVGTSQFLAKGIADPKTNSRAIVVGNSGTIRLGGYPFVGTAYANASDRGSGTNPQGADTAAYTGTPLTMTIPGKVSFGVAAITVDDLPVDFQIVSQQDILYALFVVQNPSLAPGPYYCYNCAYDFGPDQRFEFGSESDNQYASLMIQNSTTGNFYFLRSTTAGDAGDPITWDTLMTITNQGVSMRPSTQVVADADITVAATASQVVTSVSLTAARTATLQDPSEYGKNHCIDFIDGGHINGSNTLAIDPVSATIDGASGPISLSAAYESLSICTDNSATEWIVRYSK